MVRYKKWTICRYIKSFLKGHKHDFPILISKNSSVNYKYKDKSQTHIRVKRHLFERWSLLSVLKLCLQRVQTLVLFNIVNRQCFLRRKLQYLVKQITVLTIRHLVYWQRKQRILRTPWRLSVRQRFTNHTDLLRRQCHGLTVSSPCWDKMTTVDKTVKSLPPSKQKTTGTTVRKTNRLINLGILRFSFEYSQTLLEKFGTVHVLRRRT